MWGRREDPVVRMVLVMCYTGFRISAFEDPGFETHLNDELPYFEGGVKTESGRNRIVPVHSAILEFVREMNGQYLCGKSASQFRRDMKAKMVEIGIDAEGMAESRYHTPHSCRHYVECLIMVSLSQKTSIQAS